jgi:RNA polymerase sigma-70 factor (ECF subfamily)
MPAAGEKEVSLESVELSSLRFVKMIVIPTDDHRPGAAGFVQLGDWTDEDLLLEYRSKGHARTFTELVHRYEKELYGYLLRFLGDASMAEDAFQLTFLQLHLKCDQFMPGRKVRPWLYAIATHQAIDAQRRRRRQRRVGLQSPSRSDGDEVRELLDLLEQRKPGPPAFLEEEEQRQWVRDAICDLPEPLRAAVNLIYFQGLKYREAADVLSIPVGTVKSRLHAAILKLNQAWTSMNPSGVD